MQSFLLLILQFFRFWFIEAPKGMIDYFFSFNSTAMKFLSLGVLARSFFRPWKNEYREGLIGFAIFMGVIIKSLIIFFDLILLLIFIILELLLIFIFVSFPVITIILIFA